MRVFSTVNHLVVALLTGLAAAQQHSGDTIPNTLPAISGAEIAYWRITDPSGKNDHLTLINYYSLQANGARVVPSQLQRAVIVLAGDNNNTGVFMTWALESRASAQKADPNINPSTVAIISPYFPNEQNAGVGYPYTPGKGSTSNALVWSGDNWEQGSPNIYPTSSHNTSTFNVLDQLVSTFNNAAVFPNMKQVVVAGHSGGAQMAQRYAAIGQKLPLRLPLQYWVANPDSYLWFDSTRPFEVGTCSVYNNYRYGLAAYTAAPMSYGVNAVQKGGAAVEAQYQGKGIAYARGILDTGNVDDYCAPYSTGANRDERLFEFMKTYPVSCADPAGNNCDTVDYINAGHDGEAMMGSTAGQARLFRDNFYGNGTRAYDFYYPRFQGGDDPHPDPSLVNTPHIYNPYPYYGGMYSQGCFANQNPAALTNLVYNGSANSIDVCTQKCSTANNLIAAMMNGTLCYCGNSLSQATVQVVNRSCSIMCPGGTGSLSICGGPNRLSVFSKNKPVIAAVSARDIAADIARRFRR